MGKGLLVHDHVYVFVDGVEANIAGGSFGSQNQTKARLIFDNEGFYITLI